MPGQPATPARHFDRAAAGRGAEYDRQTGERLPEIPTLMEAERRLMLADEQLSDRTNEYSSLNAAAAEAKAAWEEHRDRIIVGLANEGKRDAADKRLATAKLAMSARSVPGEELYRTALITQAAAESCKVAISALQSRLSALQTEIRGLRQVTGLSG